MKNTLNPVATITMGSGSNIIIELLPDLAPNTVNSFIYLAGQNAFDNYKITRVEPGFVVDVSTNAFGREICRYLIENEAGKLPKAKRLRPDLGVIAMGGYNGNISGSEFFFPLAYNQRLDGAYPCFGRILEGIEQIEQIGSSPVKEFNYYHNPEKIMHKPVNVYVISKIRVETYGITYPNPVHLYGIDLPGHWFMENYSERI